MRKNTSMSKNHRAETFFNLIDTFYVHFLVDDKIMLPFFTFNFLVQLCSLFSALFSFFKHFLHR